MRKLKVLALATTDTHLGGHAFDQIKKMNSDLFDIKLITQFSLYHDKKYALYSLLLFKKIIERIIKPLLFFLNFGNFKIVRTSDRFAFLSYDYTIVSAKQILEKYGDSPNVIILYWYDGFISSRILKDLYDKTHASVVYVFTDEFPLGGGCHYPCECEEYKRICKNCPAIISPLGLPEKQFKQKMLLLAEIPKIVLGTSYNCRKAENSAFFKDCKTVPLVDVPDVSISMNKEEARKMFKLPKNAFVIMFGAAYVDDERKGFYYLKKALELVSKRAKERHIIVFIPGNRYFFDEQYLDNISCVFPGRLSLEELFMAFVATDVFVSPSIADAGPMMINYSIACGTPVVSFNIGVAMDLVIPDKTGYIANFKDSESMAKGILKFYHMNNDEMQKYNAECINLMHSIRNKPSGYDLLYNCLLEEFNR